MFAIVKALNTLNQLKEAAAAKAAPEDAAPGSRTCPFCHQEIADDATRCPHCTSKLSGYSNPEE